MSRFTAINQNKLHRMDAGGDASAPQMNYCPSPTAGKKRKRTQLQAGSTSAKKNTSQDSKANPISRTSKSRNSASDVSQGLKVSKPIPRMTVKSSQEIPPSGTFLWENISHMKTDATSMSENHLGPHSPLTSTAISLNGGKEGEGRNRAGKGDRVFIDASELPLRLKTPVPASPTFSKAEHLVIENDKIFPSHLTEPPQPNFLTFEAVSEDKAENLNDLHEDAKKLSQFQREFQADLAILYEGSIERSSFQKIHHSEPCSSPLIQNYRRNETNFALHEDPDFLSFGECQPLRKYDDDDFSMDDEEGIEEIMKLTELRQRKDISAPRPAFAQRPFATIENSTWPHSLLGPVKHISRRDGKALQSAPINTLNTISSSSPTSKSPNSTSLSSTNYSANADPNDAGNHDENLFDDDLFDLGHVEAIPLTSMPHTGNSKASVSSHPLQRPVKFVSKKPQPFTTSACPPEKPSPITPSSPPHPEIPHQISFDASNKPIPFTRPPFPAPIRDRCPIAGLSPRMVLRTCFRIGEALNAATIALRSPNGPDAVIELYCRVLMSSREPSSFKQNFQLADLFSTLSPVLTGTYGVWRGIGLWDHDARAFLGEEGRGKMARVVGRIKRQEGGKVWEMGIMSIWEIEWEDVGIAKGIVLA